MTPHKSNSHQTSLILIVGKKNRPVSNNPFRGEFIDPPEDDMIPMEYFKTFFTEEVMPMIIEQTNLYNA